MNLAKIASTTKCRLPSFSHVLVLLISYLLIALNHHPTASVESFSLLPYQGISRFSIVSRNNRGRKQLLLAVSRQSTSRISRYAKKMVTETEQHDLPSLDILENVLSVAIKASRAAGALICEHASGALISERKANSRDLLTVIDPLCEKTIKDTVLESFPQHEFLGEEMVPPGPDASRAALESLLSNNKGDWLWIVDPIDGTTNFVHGMPLCMPSIAVAYKKRVVVGVIYDPHRDELFSAIRGQGAYLNQETVIHVGAQDAIGDSIVAMGSPPGNESLQMSLKGVEALMPKVRTIRMLGSAALMLAWVACGRLTAYWEYDLSSWDIAAGAIIIEEAGGRFTDLCNRPYHLTTRKIIGSNGLVHEDILKELNEAGVK